MSDDKKLALTGHLYELRQRLIKSVIAVVIGSIIAFVFYEWIFYYLKLPAEGINLIFIEMTEMIGTIMKVCLASGVILAMPYVQFLPVFQRDVFQVGPTGLGLMGTAQGAGAVVGALTVASLGNYQYKGRVLVGSAMGFGAMLALFGAVAGPNTFIPSLVVLAFTGLFGTAFMAFSQALILVITPPEMRGRVTDLFMTTFGLMPLGAMPIGLLIDAYSAPLIIGNFGVATMAFFIFVTIFMPRIRNL